MIDSNTIMSEPYKIDDITKVIAISKVSVGFVVGGGEYADKSTRRVANHFPMAGGSGGGVGITPIGLIVMTENTVKYVDVENKSIYQTILNMVNSVIKKFDQKDKTKSKQSYKSENNTSNIQKE